MLNRFMEAWDLRSIFLYTRGHNFSHEASRPFTSSCVDSLRARKHLRPGAPCRASSCDACRIGIVGLLVLVSDDCLVGFQRPVRSQSDRPLRVQRLRVFHLARLCTVLPLQDPRPTRPFPRRRFFLPLAPPFFRRSCHPHGGLHPLTHCTRCSVLAFAAFPNPSQTAAPAPLHPTANPGHPPDDPAPASNLP